MFGNRLNTNLYVPARGRARDAAAGECNCDMCYRELLHRERLQLRKEEDKEREGHLRHDNCRRHKNSYRNESK